MKQKKLWQRALRWETMLVLILIVLWIVFNLKDAMLQAEQVAAKKRRITDTFNFVNMMEGMGPYLISSFMALGMSLILGMGAIDISVGATAALSAAVMAISYGAFKAHMTPGLALALAVVCCLLTGGACGALNGLLITRFRELFPMIITLGTQLLYRGLTYLLIGGSPIQYPGDETWSGLKQLYQGSIEIHFPEKTMYTLPKSDPVQIVEAYQESTINIPTILLWFLLLAALFFVFIHLTKWGRRLFAIGTNREAARLSGVKVKSFEFTMFTICGVTAAISGMFYVGSASGTMRADALKGYEMLAIAAVVLGGFSTSGGKGNIIGVVLSVFVFAVMKKGMGTVFRMPESSLDLAVGLVLIAASLLPNLMEDLSLRRRLHRQHVEAELG